MDTLTKEQYIPSDVNTLYQNENYTGHKSNIFVSKAVPNDVKNYHNFCTIFGLTQIIKFPIRITCSSISLIDYIVASASARMSQKGLIYVRLSDHQLIYCTRKINRIKTK